MNEETIDDIVAEIRAYGAQPPPRLMWLEIADRIEAACERDRTCRRSIEIPIEIKPTSASHQALSAWISLAEWLIANAGKDALGQGIAEIVPSIRRHIDESRVALSMPPRNCDVGTADEQVYRWRSHCQIVRCNGCPFSNINNYPETYADCFSRWAQAPYSKKGGSK